MHKNVNISNKMLSLVFYSVIKAAIIAEKKYNPLTRVIISFCNAGCLSYPLKHQRKHFII
jgi:uncharacterized protein YutD